VSLLWHDYLFAVGFMAAFTGLGFWIGWMLRGG
jgi:hypothetical protein